jgi:hypothetical protein
MIRVAEHDLVAAAEQPALAVGGEQRPGIEAQIQRPAARAPRPLDAAHGAHGAIDGLDAAVTGHHEEAQLEETPDLVAARPKRHLRDLIDAAAWRGDGRRRQIHGAVSAAVERDHAHPRPSVGQDLEEHGAQPVPRTTRARAVGRRWRAPAAAPRRRGRAARAG